MNFQSRRCGFELMVLVMATSPLAAQQELFDKHVAPFFASHCTKCHGADKQKGKVTLHDIGTDFSSDEGAKKWGAVLKQLDHGEMPPEDEKQPNAQLKANIVTWITQQLTIAGRMSDVHADLASPHAGNYVDHTALFDGSEKGPAWSPARLWRISPFISAGRYQNSGPLSQFRISASQPFSPSDEEGVKDYASLWRLDGPTLELLMLNAEELVKKQIGPPQAELDQMNKKYFETAKNPHPARQPSNAVLRSTVKQFREVAYSNQPPTNEQMRQIVGAQIGIALQRAATNEELARYSKMLADSIAEGGNMEGVRATVTTILLSPEAIYRMELGLGEPGSHGRRMLSQMELAFALGYALRDTGPDKEIMADAKAGKLTDRNVIAGHVKRIYDVEMEGHYRRIPAQRILRFFQEYFGYTNAPQVFKDGSRHPGFSAVLPTRLVDDTDALISHILKQDKEVVKTLLTTEKIAVYTKQKDFRLTYRAYGFPRNEFYALAKEAPKTSNGRSIYLRPGERAGILTQPSWLTAYSTNFDNDPVRRGKWIWERLLAGAVPDTPVTVDATVPTDPTKPLRARFEKTQATYCWKCHKKMNPLGMPFEMYDDIGRFRDKELLRDNKTEVPVVATGAIPGGVEVDGAVQLMQKLAEMPRVRQSFVRHAFRYWMGRNEHLDDSPTLMAADRAYVESGGSMKALVVSLLTSDSFLYRKDATPPRRNLKRIDVASLPSPNRPAKPSLAAHKFHNPNRSKTFVAVLVDYDPATRVVKARQANGTVMTFGIHHLHPDDQNYVRSNYKNAR